MTAPQVYLNYRGYLITRKWITKNGNPQPDEWEFSHVDYDGPGDTRFGSERTTAACKQRIDELEDE